MNDAHPADSGLTSQAPGVDAENPWPGLAPFTEDQQAFFHGRSRDSAELLRMVKREALTVVYGRSGLGKSSLLQAGLFPLLRKEDGLPVYIRLDHSPNAPPLAQQALMALSRAASRADVEFVPPKETQSLWEYFQHIESAFWTSRNRPATVVLVFDQFEEIFTLARTDESARKRAQDFIVQLSDLVENRVPEPLKARFEAEELRIDEYEFDHSRCKVVLSLREDYVPELQSLRSSMRSIMVVSNWKRVLPMSGQEALEAVRQPGLTIVDADVANKIVEFVAAGSRSGEHGLAERSEITTENADPMAELVVEPALLSVVCFELNRKRQARKLPKITANLLAESSTEILRDFYARSVADLPATVRVFIEDRLLTSAGHRNSEHLEEALRIEGMTSTVLEKLIGRRLVRLDTRLGATRIELTHDRLAEPVRASREQRQGELKAKAALAESSQRRKRLIGQAFTALASLCVVFFFFALWKWRDAAASGREAQKERDNAVTAMRVSDQKQQQLTKLLAKDFLDDISVAIEKGYGAAYLLKLQEMAGASGMPPYADSIAPFVGSTAYAADAVVALPEVAQSITFTTSGKYLGVVSGEGIVTVYSQTGPQNHWEPKASPIVGNDPGIVFITAHPAHGDALALRTSDGRIIIWDCDRGSAIDAPITLPPGVGSAGKLSLPMVISNDGKRIYAALSNGALYAVSTAGGEPPLVSTARGGVPTQLLMLDQGKKVISRSDRGIVPWDSQTLEQGASLHPDMPVAVTPDQKMIVVGKVSSSESDAEKVEEGPWPIVRLTSNEPGQMAISPDGKQVFFSDGAIVRVAKLPTELVSAKIDGEDGHQVLWKQPQERAAVLSVTFRPDGRVLAAVLRDTKTGTRWLKLWKAVDPPQAMAEGSRPMAVSPQGRFQVNQHPDGSLNVYEGNTRRIQLEMPDTDITLRDIAIDDSGQVTAITSVDKSVTGWYVEVARAWRWPAGIAKASELPVKMDLAKKRAVRLSLNGERAAAVGMTTEGSVVAVYDVHRPDALFENPLIAEPGPELAIAAIGSVGGTENLTMIARRDGRVSILPSGAWADAEGKSVRHPKSLLDAMIVLAERNAPAAAQQQMSREAAQRVPGMGMPTTINALVMTISKDDLVIWNARTETEKAKISVDWDDAVSAAISDDASRIAIAAKENVRVYGPDAKTFDEIQLGSIGEVHHVRLNREGQILAVGAENGVALFRHPWNEQPPRIANEGTPISRVAFSPDGRLLAITRSDYSVQVIRVDDLTPVLREPLPSDHEPGASFSPDGRTLLTFQGGRARLTDLQTSEKAGEIELGSDVRSGALMLDGQQVKLLAGFSDGTWRVMQPQPANLRGTESFASDPPSIDLEEKPPALAVASDGRVAVSVNGEDKFRLLDPPGGTATQAGPGAGPRLIETSLAISALSFTHNEGAILHIENTSGDDQYASLVDLTEEFGHEVVTSRLNRTGATRIVVANRWIALDTPLDEPSKVTQLRFPDTTVAAGIRESGVAFDDAHYRWKPLALAEHAKILNDAPATPYDPLAADFLTLWWKAQAARDQLLVDAPTPDRAILNQVYGPLLTFLGGHPNLAGRAPKEMVELLSALAPPDPNIAGKALTDHLAIVVRLPPVERDVLLNELLPRADDATAAAIQANLARTYVQRIDNLTNYNRLRRDEFLAHAMKHIAAANARGFMPTMDQQKEFKTLWWEEGFPLAWVPTNELTDRAWDLMKPNTTADNRKALPLLDVACAKDPKGYNPWLYRSIVLGRLDEHEKAIENYKTMLATQTIADKEDLARVWANLGFRYGQWGREHYPEAYAALAKALEVDPKYTTSYTYRIDLYKEEHKYDLAWADAQKLPDEPASNLSRAQLLLTLGRWTEATTELDLMVGHGRENPELWIDRANALIDGKNRALLSDAVDSAAEAISLLKKKAEPDQQRLRVFHERRGVALRRLRRFDEARQEFMAMLEIRPNDAFATAEVGAIATSIGDVDQAIQRIRQSLDIDAEDSWVLDQLSRAYLRRVPSEIVQALEAANRAVRLSGGWLPRRAEIYRRAGGDSLDLAERDLRDAIRRDVDPIQSGAALGVVLLMRHRPDDARGVFEQVLASQPWVGDEETRARALALAFLGRYDDAMTTLALIGGQPHPDPDRYKVAAQINVLRAAAGPDRPVPNDNPLLLVALHDLLQHARWADVDYGDVAFDFALAGISQHPLFRDLIQALQKPRTDSSRDLMLARTALTLATRLRAIDSLPAQWRVDCLQAADQFQKQAKEHGASDAQILNMTREVTVPAR